MLVHWITHHMNDLAWISCVHSIIPLRFCVICNDYTSNGLMKQQLYASFACSNQAHLCNYRQVSSFTASLVNKQWHITSVVSQLRSSACDPTIISYDLTTSFLTSKWDLQSRYWITEAATLKQASLRSYHKSSTESSHCSIDRSYHNTWDDCLELKSSSFRSQAYQSRSVSLLSFLLLKWSLLVSLILTLL